MTVCSWPFLNQWGVRRHQSRFAGLHFPVRLAFDVERAANQPTRQFVTAHAIVTDHQYNLWVFDPATPKRSGPAYASIHRGNVSVQAVIDRVAAINEVDLP